MKKETLKNIFDFLEEKENKKHKDSRSLKWKLFFNKSITKEELNVNGDLNLKGLKLKSLPEGLKVGGELDLYWSRELTSLPKTLKAEGDLNLGTCTSLTSLPKGFKVGGRLNLSHCENLTSLPEGLEVGGSLWLIESWGLKSLPKGLYVGGSLHIQRTNFTNLSDDEIRDMIKPGFIEGKIYK
jgi:hypothetical protein